MRRLRSECDGVVGEDSLGAALGEDTWVCYGDCALWDEVGVDSASRLCRLGVGQDDRGGGIGGDRDGEAVHGLVPVGGD